MTHNLNLSNGPSGRPHSSTPRRVILVGLALGLCGTMVLAWLNRQPESDGALAPRRPNGNAVREASAELDHLRHHAAGEFRQLAATHEVTARTRLERVLQIELARARGRVPEFAAWLLSFDAVGTLGAAWWNDRVAEKLAEQSEQRLISGPEVSAHLQRQVDKLREDLGSATDEISRRHVDRIASVLSRLDEPTRRAVEFSSLGTDVADMVPVVHRYQAAEVANVLLGTAAVTAGLESLGRWLAPKIGFKLASKGIRTGTGPVGWAVSLAGGWYVEKKIDEHLILPSLESRLQKHLDTVAISLLRTDGPAAQLAKEQSKLVLRMAEDLERPRTHSPSTASVK